ncbi:Panacea domain-containing protein [Neogemmobacter tilapiae]|uniref:Antitoxin SocA-like Panacea domain-containing protein n=1 Tax=Neogemmobacter tilapiae TaxID=875041 RepID=A0A918TY21_9RHOB|nr:Panacea domain-containing protein [Gemmobacter tilapiae]GHC66108.1 hypothetical protein GCM10007315_33500 [Gemmobacter tilapiae]
MNARYRFAAIKALQAIDFMVSQKNPLDLHAALKACYFADRSHLNTYQQPIFGATYKAMKYGPVPLEIYELIKGEPLRLWEIGRDDLPWTLEGRRIRRIANGEAHLDQLADSEREHLAMAFAKSVAMDFGERTAVTHGADWQAANGGEMLYEDMIDPGPSKAEVVQFIRETARYVRL